MKKHLFNEHGLQALLQELYSLPQNQLLAESIALRTAPKSWIDLHFQLEAGQQTFLDEMPLKVSQFLGDQGSFAVANKLPITIAKDGEETDPDGKLFFPKSSLAISTNNEGSTNPSGFLEIQITYNQ